jgi:hypothetical protein
VSHVIELGWLDSNNVDESFVCIVSHRASPQKTKNWIIKKNSFCALSTKPLYSLLQSLPVEAYFPSLLMRVAPPVHPGWVFLVGHTHVEYLFHRVMDGGQDVKYRYLRLAVPSQQ